MNKKTALIKSLLKGDIINVSNSIKYTGYSNPAREIPRQIEKPFNCIVSRCKMDSKDQWGNYVTWYDYRLNPLISGNKTAIKKMKQYVAENN
jgi:hypothetical protein